jgi:putative DNA primase/helicase
MLAGKRLNVVSELPEADILQAESFKAVVSGDSMTGRHIRQAPFTFRPVAGHIFAGNRLPGTNDQTHGFWRRILVAQFNRIFAVPEQDPKLAERLVEAELPSIVSWFLAGAARVLAQGSYTIPASSSAAVEKWKRHADQVRAFVSEWTAVLPLDAPTSEWIISADLYRAYRTWATENGHRVVAVNTFGQRMEQIGLPARHSDVGSRYPVRLEFRRFGVDE